MCASQKVTPLSIEGASTSQWILIDYGDVVTHVFRSDIREHYGLEKLWRDAGRVPLPSLRPAPSRSLPLHRQPPDDRMQKQG